MTSAPEPRPLPRDAVLIVNAMSRSGQDAFDEACAKLTAAGVTLTASHALQEPDALIPTVQKAVNSGAAMVIVGGGDGSLSSAVDCVVGRDCVFALLPLGTANSFARTLGIPLDIDGAVDAIANGRRRRIDLGMIDGDYFANCAAMGMSPLIAETVPHKLKKYGGRVGYFAWAAWRFIAFKPFRITIEPDDGSGPAHTLHALEVRIANGPYHGGTVLVDDAEVDSGEIIVQVVEGRTKGRLALSWMFSLLRMAARHQTTRDFHGRALRIRTDPPLPISIDGEVLAKTPVIAKVARGAIEVAVPAE